MNAEWTAVTAAVVAYVVGLVSGIGFKADWLRQGRRRDDEEARAHLAHVLTHYGVQAQTWDDDLLDLAQAVDVVAEQRRSPE